MQTAVVTAFTHLFGNRHDRFLHQILRLRVREALIATV